MTTLDRIHSKASRLDPNRQADVELVIDAMLARRTEPVGLPHVEHRVEAAELRIPALDDRRDVSTSHLVEGHYYQLSNDCNEQSRGRVVRLDVLESGWIECSYADDGKRCYPTIRSLQPIPAAPPPPTAAARVDLSLRDPRVGAIPPAAPTVTEDNAETDSALTTGRSPVAPSGATHAMECASWRLTFHRCNCPARDGHDSMCAIADGMKHCDCSAPVPGVTASGKSPGVASSLTVSNPQEPGPPPIGARCAIRIAPGNDAWGTVVEDKARPGKTLILIDGRGHVSLEKVAVVWWGVD